MRLSALLCNIIIVYFAKSFDRSGSVMYLNAHMYKHKHHSIKLC